MLISFIERPADYVWQVNVRPYNTAWVIWSDSPEPTNPGLYLCKCGKCVIIYRVRQGRTQNNNSIVNWVWLIPNNRELAITELRRMLSC